MEIAQGKMVPSRYLAEWKLLVERDVDVNACRAFDMHLWPLVWIYLGLQLVNDDLALIEKWLADPTLSLLPPRLKEECEAIETAINERRRKQPGNWFRADDLWRPPRSPHGGIAVYTLPSQHHVRMDSGYFAPMIDPIAIVAARRTVTRKFEWISQDSFSRQPRIFPSMGLLLGENPDTCWSNPETINTAITTFVEEVVDHGARINMPFPSGLAENTSELVLKALQNIRNVQHGVEDLFRVQPPRYLVLSCYHHDVAWAVRLAARTFGVPTFDVQHGFTGTYNWQNSHWSALPSDGYALLPDAFAVWDQRSARHVSRFWPANGHPHRIVEVGRPDLSFDVLPDEWRSHVDNVAKLVEGWEKVALVTLSSTASGGFNEVLIGAMKMAPKNWLWLIRCHPVASDKTVQPAGVMEALMNNGVQNARVYEPSALPLAALLLKADHHITSFSSSVFDAAGLGVPTTFMSPLSLMLTPDLVRDKLARYAKTPAELTASLIDDAAVRVALAAESLAAPGTHLIDGLFDCLLSETPPDTGRTSVRET